MTYLLLTVRWLDDRYHGLLDREGPPEWPPSPFRLFQALVAGVARQGELDSALGESLAWLQTLEPPTIVAPRSRAGQVVTHFVPNNDGDKKPDRQDRLKGKTFRPTLFLDAPEIHYLWPIDADGAPLARLVCQAARSLTCLGWGIDMAYADGRLVGSDDVAGLFGVRWHPRRGVVRDSGLLRVPVVDRETNENTLCDLKRAHQSGLNRVVHENPLNTVEKPKVFDRVFYESKEKLLARPHAAFSLLKPDASGFRSFDTPRRTRDVAGMIRHAVAELAERIRPFDWTDADINQFVHGKTSDGLRPASGETSPDRFMYLPLPTINAKLRRVESIRRVMVVAPPHCREQIAWVTRALSGAELYGENGQEHETVALLTILPRSDWVFKQYTTESAIWSTVTPMILPRHDHGKADKACALVRMAFEQAGYARELLDQTEVEWRRVGFRAGLDLASHYLPPENLSNKPRYHIRVRFPHPVRGPIAVGGGRFRGFGLFAAES